jgi:hypothetical protein
VIIIEALCLWMEKQSRGDRERDRDRERKRESGEE